MEEKVKRWIDLSAKLAVIKSQELELRNEIAAHILQEKIKGTKKGVIGPYILSAEAKLNTNIDKEGLRAIWPDLSPLEKSAVKFDPKIIAAKYKKLDENSLINQAITKKPGTPGLTLKGMVDD